MYIFIIRIRYHSGNIASFYRVIFSCKKMRTLLLYVFLAYKIKIQFIIAQPDNFNNNEDCVEATLNGWNDFQCPAHLPFCCQWRKSALPNIV